MQVRNMFNVLELQANRDSQVFVSVILCHDYLTSQASLLLV